MKGTGGGGTINLQQLQQKREPMARKYGLCYPFGFALASGTTYNSCATRVGSGSASSMPYRAESCHVMSCHIPRTPFG